MSSIEASIFQMLFKLPTTVRSEYQTRFYSNCWIVPDCQMVPYSEHHWFNSFFIRLPNIQFTDFKVCYVYVCVNLMFGIPIPTLIGRGLRSWPFFWGKTGLEVTSWIAGTGTGLHTSGLVARDNSGRDCSVPLGKFLNGLEIQYLTRNFLHSTVGARISNKICIQMVHSR